MKLNLVVSLIFVLCALGTAADFSGTWVLNTEKSELGEGRGGRMAASKMVVMQTDETITIESTRTGRNGEERNTTEEMTLDGKESKTSTDWAEIRSSAALTDDVLVISQIRTFTRNDNAREIKSEQKWTVVDGSLMIDMTAESPRGERKIKFVYDKK